MKKYISLLTYSLCLLNFATSCQEDFSHRLQREANNYTQQHCPYVIEEGTTLDSVTYNIETKTYTHWHTLDGVLDTPQARAVTLQNQPLVKNHLLRALRGNTKWETCKQHKVDFCYRYNSKSLNKEILSITLTAEDYKES